MKLHDAEESLAIRKILTDNIRMKKNPQTKEDTFWTADFYGVMPAQSPTCTEISSMASLTPKLSIYCYVFKYFVFTDLKKKHTYFDRKFIVQKLTLVRSNHLNVF